jgi:chromosome segregation protein
LAIGRKINKPWLLHEGMTHIKNMVIHGFKSFAKKTDIPFDKEINLFIGANGSGKSNVAEALCFALGRLSAKSMRAVKAKNLIFMGSKYIKPSKDAYVELVFDNSDRTFSIDREEVSLKRMVRHKGQSVYKINDEVKTRGEVIEMLAQAGIDPYGFNLVMQGKIQSIVKMHPEERRKIIEEVSGISIYESRKEKSLKELDKTDARLKEISTVLRERTAYLRNLEKEKAQAQKYKDSELVVKRAKASILNKKKIEKEKEVLGIRKSIEEKDGVKGKLKSELGGLRENLETLGEEINDINRQVQKASGMEQESLHEKITDLKAELEGSRVRKESYENRQTEVEKRIEEIENGIPEMEGEISELREKSPGMAKKSEELKKKKVELEIIEAERKKLLSLKSDLEGLRARLDDKERHKVRIGADANALVERLEEVSGYLKHEDAMQCSTAISSYKKSLLENKEKVVELHSDELKHEKSISASDAIINRAEEIKLSVNDMDVCPVCQSKITDKHKGHVRMDSDSQIEKAGVEKKGAQKEVGKVRKLREKVLLEINEIEESLGKHEDELGNHRHISDKKEQLKKIVEEEKVLDAEILELKKKRENLEGKSSSLEAAEAKYEKMLLDIEEISSRTEKDVDTTLLYKERELENMRNIVKRSEKDLEGIGTQIEEIDGTSDLKEAELGDLEKKEEMLQARFKKMFETRDTKQSEIQEKNLQHSELQSELRQIEEQVNYLKVGKAKLEAEKEAIEMELAEFVGVEILSGSMQIVEERLRKAQDIVQNIGAINLKALEVYGEVKEEYDKIYEKVETLETEKADILKIVDQIDKRKKKAFMKTFSAINDLFSENFSKLSSKGSAYLHIENKEDIFDGGVSIVVKFAKGKYFDVTSLSGGEQTLVALSLLFSIQKHKPYHFYIFDEIDAALDKRNSERLAGLIHQYMKSGQYIVITHNDAIITKSNVLYGVSMHEGESKILGLKV